MATDQHLSAIDAWWRAANYLSVGQLYLRQNALLRRPLESRDIKRRLLGHWGTTPGLTFVYAHLNRVITQREQDMLLIAGPGHGGPALVAGTWLEGTYSETYGDITRDEAGMDRLVRQFSYPGGIPSHAAPETPGSINEGGELGYSLAHGFGAVLDNPGLVAAVVVGDGEAETGALSGSWDAHVFLDPRRDGAVLPILHLNGWKIANPTILARMPQDQLEQRLRGHGYEPFVVTVDDPDATDAAHRDFAAALDACLDRIAAIQARAREGAPADAVTPGDEARREPWPMIVLRSPKGWTGPAEVDGKPVEGTWRAHQIPLTVAPDDDAARERLTAWLRSYRPEELFDEQGRPRDAVTTLNPAGDRRLGATPFANGGRLLAPLRLPAWQGTGVAVAEPGRQRDSPMATLGTWLAEVIRANPETFRLFGPDETASNRLQNVFTATDKAWNATVLPVDEHLAPDGRVIEVLSEHLCQGLLEGYLLTGRHGVFDCYEAFVHIVDSMFNQHAKWLKVHQRLPWRRPIASFTYLLSSHVWQQDHNGFSHQDPGFIDHAVNKSADVVRVYLPPDTNTLLCTMDHCLRSQDRINIVVSGKHPSLTWLGPEAAAHHCARGLGVWDFAGTERPGEQPDVVLACAGDVPTIETVAAAQLLAHHVPELAVRVVNVVDLMRLIDDRSHPHGLSDADFDGIFTEDRPVIFAYHGYASLIHRLTYKRANHAGLHVRGYHEEGTTTTPFDMALLNGIDRYQLVIDVIDRVPALHGTRTVLRQRLMDAQLAAREYTREVGDDPDHITGWSLAADPVLP
ncbi:putative phosphoketolase [Tersicoccus solisilvae]|uniref:Phosphoketolase n=1 Tax=Tersicoccus solisilvae TaxID=1882339 RepID=A0ABQ1NYF7_9MICC|nr:phosphoketolase family protein [Tersicoccus solisilvae]GGC87113.1 putative phosphoketolase [Tersicoccus solisilvae]